MTTANGSTSREERNKANFAPYDQKAAEYPHGYIPAQPNAIGSLLPTDRYPQNEKPPKAFEPITVRGVTFPHRLWVSPMCMYSSDDGHATDFHFVHIGSMATRGWQGIMIEATAVVPEGRISPRDAGLWTDSQIAPLKRQVDFVHAHKGTIGIQLAHAGRKASTVSPFLQKQMQEEGWEGGLVPDDAHGGWANTVVGPSELSFHDEKYPHPKEMSLDDIEALKVAYKDAVRRCKEIGFDFIEIHGAHGYLMHNFVDPISNNRKDKYGGSLENRLRLPLELAELVRKEWDGPLFYRLSASDWLEEALGPEKGNPGQTEEYAWWGIDQTTILTQKLADLGVDLIDVSSGGNDLRAKIKVGPSYQLHFASHIKKNTKNILVAAVGIITEPKQANDIIANGDADIVFFAREVLRHIDFPLEAAQELGAAVAPIQQYELAWTRMVIKRKAPEAPKHEAKSDKEAEKDGEKESNAAAHQSIP